MSGSRRLTPGARRPSRPTGRPQPHSRSVEALTIVVDGDGSLVVVPRADLESAPLRRLPLDYGRGTRQLLDVAEALAPLTSAQVRTLLGEGPRGRAFLRSIPLRYSGRCAGCGVALPVGERAAYHVLSGVLRCKDCARPRRRVSAATASSPGSIPGRRRAA